MNFNFGSFGTVGAVVSEGYLKQRRLHSFEDVCMRKDRVMQP